MLETAPPQERPDRVGEFFSKFAGSWDSLYGAKRNVLWRLIDDLFRRDIYERYQLTFAELGKDLSGKALIDVGCGSGVYCFEAAKRGASRVVGLDVSEGMIALARSEAAASPVRRSCEFACSAFPPATTSDVIKEKFDDAIVMGVMDYVADATEFLSRLRPLVSDRVMVSFPGRHWLRAPLRSYRYKLLGRCAIYTYDQKEIENAFASAGFNSFTVKRLNHSGICYFVTGRC